MAGSHANRVGEFQSLDIPRTGFSHEHPRFFMDRGSHWTSLEDPQTKYLVNMTEQFKPQEYLLMQADNSTPCANWSQSMATVQPRFSHPSHLSPQCQSSSLASVAHIDETDFGQDFLTGSMSNLASVPASNRLTINKVSQPHEDQVDSALANLTSSGRKSRSHVWPPNSDPPTLIPRPDVFDTRVIGHTGRESGRNLLVLFEGGDGLPRTRYNLRILRARGPTYLPEVQHYPPSNVDIPGGMSLWEICHFFPRHVWGTGLRMFIAEGWAGEQIFNALPSDFRDSRAVQRPWNYIQQGYTREVRRMNEEAGVIVTPSRKRKREGDVCDAVKRTNSSPRAPPVLSNFVYNNDSPEPNITSTVHAKVHESSALVKYDRVSAMNHNDQVSCDVNKGELGKQEGLLLVIMNAHCPQYCNELLDDQLERVRYCHQNLCLKHGIDLENPSLEELIRLTSRLEKDVQKIVKQAECGEDYFSEFIEDVYLAANNSDISEGPNID